MYNVLNFNEDAEEIPVIKVLDHYLWVNNGHVKVGDLCKFDCIEGLEDILFAVTEETSDSIVLKNTEINQTRKLYKIKPTPFFNGITRIIAPFETYDSKEYWSGKFAWDNCISVGFMDNECSKYIEGILSDDGFIEALEYYQRIKEYDAIIIKPHVKILELLLQKYWNPIVIMPETFCEEYYDDYFERLQAYLIEKELYFKECYLDEFLRAKIDSINNMKHLNRIKLPPFKKIENVPVETLVYPNRFKVSWKRSGAKIDKPLGICAICGDVISTLENHISNEDTRVCLLCADKLGKVYNESFGEKCNIERKDD